MREVKIFLRTEQDAIGFINIVAQYSYDVDMAVGRHVVDAKSIMGVLGIGIGKETRLCMNTEQADALIQELSPYLFEGDE